MNNEKPEIYAVRQDSGNWQISRRDFLKAAGIGAAALGAGLESGCSRPKPLDSICGDITAHKSTITGLILSADGKYLVSSDKDHLSKCWDFEKQSLLGSVKQNFGFYAAGYHNGKSCLFTKIGDGQIIILELPLTEMTTDQAAVESPVSESVVIPDLDKGWFIVDSSENIYTDSYGSISIYRKEDGYQHKELLYEPEHSGSGIKDMRLFDGDAKLFVQWNQSSSYGILDLETRKLARYKSICSVFAILPDNVHALICSDKSYSLMDLGTGEAVWTQQGPQPGGGKVYAIKAAAVMADGSAAVLLVTYNQKCWLYMVSLADGSQLSEYEAGYLIRSDSFAGPVLSPDGTKMALAIDKTILYFSLPDLMLIGCPMDVDEAKNDKKGVEISAKDSVTGETYTYTMPCGAAIPNGAVCTCNCVKGRGGCACDGHSRSNKNSGGARGGSHYWHPN